MNCHDIHVVSRRVGAIGLLAVSLALASPAMALEICCQVVSIDARNATVSAKETATGRGFAFRVADRAVLKQIRPGMSFDLEPALSRLEKGSRFSLTLGSAPADSRVLASATGGARLERCCNLLAVESAKPGRTPAGSLPTRVPPRKTDLSREVRSSSSLLAKAPRIPDAATRIPEPPEPVNYAIDVAELHCRKIWYHGIGKRDRVLLELWAYDAASNDKGAYLAYTFNCRTDMKKHLGMDSLFQAADLKGDVQVSGNFMITHPKNGKNIRDAMKRFVDLEVDVTAGVINSGIVDLPDGVTKLIATFTGADVRSRIVEARGNFLNELFEIAGRAVCAGGTPLTWNKSIGLNPLDEAFFDDWGGKRYKLWYTSQGAKPKTCFREIKYDLFARILKQEK